MKGADSYMKLLLVVFWEKIHLGQFDRFRPFFTVSLGMVEIESGYCYYWILSQDMISFMITTGSLNSQDMISQLNIYVMDIVWISCDVYVCRSKFNRGSYGFVKLL